MGADQIRPVITGGTVTVVNGGAHGQITDTAGLQNPFQTPMYVDEIRIKVRPPAGFSAGHDFNLGAFVRLRLELSSRPISDGYVPVSLYGSQLNRELERVPITSLGDGQVLSRYTWRLPRPMLVMPNQMIQPIFYYSAPTTMPQSGVSSPARAVCQVLFVGRSIPKTTPTPAHVDIPYIDSFVGAGKALGVNSTDKTTTNDIANPFRVPLDVQYFTGRIFLDEYDADSQSNISQTATGGAGNNSFDQGCSVAAQTLVRAYDRAGHMLVKDKTPWSSLFQTLSHAWQVSTRMLPQSFYQFELTENYANASLSGSQNVVPMIGMIGTRRELL